MVATMSQAASCCLLPPQPALVPAPDGVLHRRRRARRRVVQPERSSRPDRRQEVSTTDPSTASTTASIPTAGPSSPRTPAATNAHPASISPSPPTRASPPSGRSPTQPLRSKIEDAHNSAASRMALQQIFLKECSYTRTRDGGSGRRYPGNPRQDARRHVPARHQPRRRPPATHALRALQRRRDRPGRRVASASPETPLSLDQGGRRLLPRPDCQQSRRPRHQDGTPRKGQRLRSHQKHAPRTSRTNGPNAAPKSSTPPPKWDSKQQTIPSRAAMINLMQPANPNAATRTPTYAKHAGTTNASHDTNAQTSSPPLSETGRTSPPSTSANGRKNWTTSRMP